MADPVTTAAMSGPKQGARSALTPQQILEGAALAAKKLGLGPEGARVIQAILRTEGGLDGSRGDGGQSVGPLQFYRDKGQLPNFASALGVTQDAAARIAEQNPMLAITWALSGYLGDAIRSGMKQGLRGPDLATHAQRTGQVSESPERAGQWYTNLFGATPAEAAELNSPETGGASVSDTRAPAASQSQAAFDKVVAAKGNPISVNPLDREIDDPDIKGQKMPNPAPTFRYVFSDGTHLDVRSDASEDGKATALTIIGGNALSSIAATDNKPKPTAADKLEPIKDPNTGRVIKLRDPATGTVIDLPDPAQPGKGQVVTVNGKHYREDPSGAFVPVQGLPDVEKPEKQPQVITHDGATYLYYPDGTVKQLFGKPNRLTPIQSPSKTDPYLVFQDENGNVVTKANPVYDPSSPEALKAQRELMGPQQLALQNHLKMIADVQQQIASGQLTPEEGDRYVDAAKSYTDAVMQGTTPWQQKQEKQRRTESERSDALTALNQRLQSGASLANSFVSNAVQGAAHAFKPAGGFNLDPGGFAQGIVDRFSPPGVGNWAANMLTAANPTEALTPPIGAPGGLPTLGTGGMTPWTAAAIGQAAPTPGANGRPPVGATFAGAAAPSAAPALPASSSLGTILATAAMPTVVDPQDEANRDQWFK